VGHQLSETKSKIMAEEHRQWRRKRERGDDGAWKTAVQ
jgi:hypothetical protein